MTKTVVHKFDFSEVASFFSTCVLAYGVTTLSVEKFAQIFFPSMEEAYKTAVKAAYLGIVLHAYSLEPEMTVAATLLSSVVMVAITALVPRSKYVACPPFLDNLNEKFKGMPQMIVGNERRVKELQRALVGLDKKNALMIGLPGIGKTKLVEGIAWELANNQIQDKNSVLFGKTIFSLNLNDMVADTGIVGTFDAKVRDLVRFVESRPDAILFVDELHEILGAGTSKDNPMSSLAQKLKPHIITRHWRVIGALTQLDFQKYLSKDPAVFRRFNQVWLSEPTRDECSEILTHLTQSASFKEIYPSVVFEQDDILRIIEWTYKIGNMQVGQPDRAKDVLEEAAKLALEGQKPIKEILIKAIENKIKLLAKH